MATANRDQILMQSKTKLRMSAPKLLVHLFMAGLIWIFGQLIFIPLAASFALFGYNLAPIVAAIIVVALTIALVRAAFDIRDTADALAGISAVSVSRSSTEPVQVENYRKAFRGIMYILYAVLIFLFFYAFLATIHPALAGVVLVVIVVWAVIVLFQAGGGFSRAIEQWATRGLQRIDEQLQVGETGVRIEPRKETESEGESKKESTTRSSRRPAE